VFAQHLFLTGYRGTGKSTVGQLVALELAYPFLDTDERIELDAGKTIGEIFETLGEPHFRDLESLQLIRLQDSERPMVVSLGGGAVVRPDNRALINKLGATVWLQATPENIAARIANDPNTQSRRPKLSTLGNLEEVRSKLAERWAWYNEVADIAIVCDDRAPEEIAKTIVEWYRQFA
jgi:shikimate kinase